MTLARWRAPILLALGALMVIVTSIGLVLQRENALGAFVLLALVQGAVYVGAVALTWRGGWSTRAVAAMLAVAAVMRLGVLLAPPYLSDDINRYVWDGRVEAAGINPYRYVPADPHLAALRDDAIFPNINRRTYATTIYPPVAEYIFFLATRINQSVMAMKAAMLAFEAAGVALLLRLLVLLGLPRGRILVYAWHPLTLWEFAGNGHVDAAVIAFLALALWARQREASATAGVALAAAALVKFLPAVVFPALWRRCAWTLPVAAIATAVIAYLPFIGAGSAVLGFLPGYVREEGLQSGSGFFLWNLLKSMVAPLGALGVLPYLALAAAIMAALAFAIVRRDRSADRFIAAAMTLAVAGTVLFSPHYAWYFAWIVPFLCFAPRPSALYLTVAAPLLYLVPGGPDPGGARMTVQAAIYGPFAALFAIELWRRRARRADARWIKIEG
jgi:alpha-1,6-mannosyltransferase